MKHLFATIAGGRTGTAAERAASHHSHDLTRMVRSQHYTQVACTDILAERFTQMCSALAAPSSRMVAGGVLVLAAVVIASDYYFGGQVVMHWAQYGAMAGAGGSVVGVLAAVALNICDHSSIVSREPACGRCNSRCCGVWWKDLGYSSLSLGLSLLVSTAIGISLATICAVLLISTAHVTEVRQHAHAVHAIYQVHRKLCAWLCIACATDVPPTVRCMAHAWRRKWYL